MYKRQGHASLTRHQVVDVAQLRPTAGDHHAAVDDVGGQLRRRLFQRLFDGGDDGRQRFSDCLLYTSDAADEPLCVDLGGRRIIKKKKHKSVTIHMIPTSTMPPNEIFRGRPSSSLCTHPPDPPVFLFHAT